MKISVIIPVYNNLQLSIQCIESLGRHSFSADQTEIIIVDDGSDDGTAEYFTWFASANPWLIYHRNAGNLKFARSCNAGAGLARGKYLIFLNNDTVVTQNWDKFLIESLEKDENTWMAGAKLLYADGTLQHAGVYLPEPGKTSISHVYRGFPSCFPPANTEKELQCVTAACMVMRKSDFIELGGFDTSFRNGMEDVDLCLRIIEKGKKIRYQPLCEVIHFESKSEGRYTHSKDNTELFYTRWNGKIRPDSNEMILNDIHRCVETGALVPDGEKKALSIDASKMAYLAVPFTSAKDDDELLIVLRCTSTEKAEVKLSAKTRSGYQDGALFEPWQILNPGENMVLFHLSPAWSSGQCSLVFRSDGAAVIGITKISTWRFKNPTREKPSVSIICHPENNNINIKELNREFEKAGIKAELSLDKIPSSFTSSEINRAIKNSDAGYIMVLDKDVEVNPEFIINALEIMELQPKIGFIYSDMNVKEGDNTFLFKNDFNPFTILTKGKTDMTGLFRKKCWDSIRGFDETLSCFIHYDLFLGILAGGNWAGYKVKYTAFEKTVDDKLISFDYKSERDRILSKNARFLVKECGKILARERQAIKKI